MSLFGKLLALLNFLGAAGLVYVASIDYGKRQSWAYSAYRHDLVIRGLPVDESEQDEDGVPLVARISDDDRNDLFKGAGGNPVATQSQEVQRQKGQLDAKLEAVKQSKTQYTYHLARVLLPLSDTYLEREQLQACRVHLATDQSAQALKAACQKALQEALRPGPADLPEQPFARAYRSAFRGQGGEPAESFVSLLLRQIPDDRKKAAAVNFDAAYEAALEAQRAGLEARYKGLFAEAAGQPAESAQQGAKPGLQLQKAAIARLLFGLCLFFAEDSIFADQGKEAERKPLQGAASQAAYQEALIATPTYKQNVNRVLVVCGMRSALGAISERASVVRRLSDSVATSLTQERQDFVYDHAAIIERLREQATIVRSEQSVINDSKERLAAYETVVSERKKEIEKLTDELKQSRGASAAEIKKLRELSQQVLDLRVKIRDAITANEKGEQRIRDLEQQVRDRDRRGRD